MKKSLGLVRIEKVLLEQNKRVREKDTKFCSSCGTQTHNLLLSRQAHYPLCQGGCMGERHKGSYLSRQVLGSCDARARSYIPAPDPALGRTE